MSLNLEQLEPSDKGKTSMPVNLGTQQLSSTNKQSAQVDLLPRFHPTMPVNIGSQQLPSSDGHLSQGSVQASVSVNHGSYQLGFTNKQSVQMGLPPKVQARMSVYMGFQQLSSANRLPLEKESSFNIQNLISVNVGSQLSASKKRPAQREAPPKFQTSMPINLRLQQLSSTNKHPSLMEPEPTMKVQTESFKSVRSKLRESLAASLTMVSNQQNKQQVVEKNSPIESVSTGGHEEVSTEPVELCSTTSNPSLSGSSSDILTSFEHVRKFDEGQVVPSDAGPNENSSDHTQVWNCDVQEDQPKHVTLENEVPFSNSSIIKDELLQGNGPCWASDVDAENSEKMTNQGLKRPKLVHEEVTERPKLVHEEITGDTKDISHKNPESLAIKIEAELFRLFGGVNKKYKEKGRSLLFNLKDRNNPELRERVLSGDIAPECLCSMTAEELASKELSEWRLAKAEELVQMVVLPDSEVDIRRLVRKTHKGEFQVEVEQDDSVSVEVVGASVLSQSPTKAIEEVQTQSKSNMRQVLSKPHETKASEGLLLSEKADSGDQNVSGNLDTLLKEKADFMQEFLVDKLKDTEFLPPIVSLDEFMEASDSEPSFENLSMNTVQDTPGSAEKNSDSLDAEMSPASASDCLGPKSYPASHNLVSKLGSSQDSLGSKLYSADAGSENPEDTATGNTGKEDLNYTRPDGSLNSGSVHAEPDNCLPRMTSKSENIWEGLIQLNISAPATVIGFFRSGEKTSTQEWPAFLEIKGRVRLDAFEKFLQELPLSRSRAIMIAQFYWKEGSPENGRLNVCETVDSYIADERVGFAEPAPGVELYFCPPHPKTTEMLGRHLSKDHTQTLHLTVNGLIGVVVWRRPHVTSVSPRLPLHHMHSSSTKKQFSSGKQQQNIIKFSNSTSSGTSIPLPSGPPSTNPQPPLKGPIDDVPPGFGPGNPRVEDDDDLPVFDFVHGSSQPKGWVGMTYPRALPQPPPLARPVEQMRELIQKYGHGENAKKPGIKIQPWNDDDDDDIPEWHPHQDNQPKPQQLPPPPPLPQIHNYQQQTMQQPFLVNQHLVLVPPYQQMPQPNAPPQQLMPLGAQLPRPLQLPIHPQMGLMSGQHNVHPGWQQALWWPPAQGPADMGVGLPTNGLIQPCHLVGQPSDGQFYGVPAFGAVQNGMGWRPDVPRSRGV